MKKIISLLLGFLLCLSTVATAAEFPGGYNQASPKDITELCGVWTGVGGAGELPCMVIHEDGTMEVYEVLLCEDGELGQMLFHGAYTYDAATGLFTFPAGAVGDQPYHAYLSTTVDEYDEEKNNIVNLLDEPIQKGTVMLIFEGTVEDPDLGIPSMAAAKMPNKLLTTAGELCSGALSLLSGEWNNPFADGDDDEEDDDEFSVIDGDDYLGDYFFREDGTGSIQNNDQEIVGTFTWSLDGDLLTVSGDAALNGSYFIQHAVHPNDDVTDLEAVEVCYGQEVFGIDCWLDPDTLMLSSIGADGKVTTLHFYRVPG